MSDTRHCVGVPEKTLEIAQRMPVKNRLGGLTELSTPLIARPADSSLNSHTKVKIYRLT
jgi:hypothetical protein